MLNKPSEERLAKNAYNWLRISPVLTILTLFTSLSFGIGEFFCDTFLACDEIYGTYNSVPEYINAGIGVLVSGCWHLLLLQYVNNKESAFVRKHGTQALTYAGVRTAVAFTAVLGDFFLESGGGLSCAAVVLLTILWFVQTNLGMEKIKEDIQADPNISREPTSAQATISTEEPKVYLTQENKTESNEIVSTEVTMTENETKKPEEILNEILANLKSNEADQIQNAFSMLKTINYSSEAIRRQVERLAMSSTNSKVRDEAYGVLNLPSNRAVQKASNKMDRGLRFTILNEIKKWVNDGLLTKENGDVLQSRYDFDFGATPQTAPTPVSAQQKISQPEKVSVPEKPAEPKGPPPTLLQTLTSEASIKVYLYLGAFFVIAAAAILGAVVPELRLPILMIGTISFGGLSLAIKKRLPQPSFALFIVFSFLLPITANIVEQTLRDDFDYAPFVTSIYWVFVLFVLTTIWSFGTKLYNSKLFSITAYGALVSAFINGVNAFEGRQPELYPFAVSIAAFGGLAGVWLIKKWKDASFALPVFFLTQLTQAVVLFTSFSIFSLRYFSQEPYGAWHLVSFVTWILACIFILLSDKQYTFVLYPWFAATTLIPLPWFICTTFGLENLGIAIVLFVWGIVLAIASEIFNRSETLRKFSLPVLLASMPAFVLSLVSGLVYEVWLGALIAFFTAILFTGLHIIRTRWWLWALALVSFVIAYFSSFQIAVIENLNINASYQNLFIGLLFLLPDLFLKKEWSDKPEHRLPLRIFGLLLSLFAMMLLVTNNKSSHATIGFAIFTLFITIYSLAYRKSWLMYLVTTFLSITVLYAIDYFSITESWLLIFTALTFLYFLFGVTVRSKENWSLVLRNSALALSAIIAFASVVESNTANGWYVFALGFLFIAEMIIRKEGIFEIGAPIFFSISAFHILRSLDVNQTSTQLLVHSLIWIFSDILEHLLYKHPRPLSIVVRSIGALIAILNYGFLFTASDLTATIGFGIYTLLWLTVNLVYRQSNLFYAFTLTLPLFVIFLFRNINFTKWIHPVIVLTIFYYASGFVLRAIQRLKGWDSTLLYSGLGISIIVSVSSWILGGIDTAIPVAVAATLWAVEAFSKKNAWLAFPANVLYLSSYFIILNELDVQEVQFFSIGAALIGLIQHYLLVRAGSKNGAFVMGMLSQFILLGTTYLEMVNKNELAYFFLLFLQSLAVLIYGLVIRSRSLTFFPIGFVVLGVFTVAYSALQEVGAIFLIGCTGIVLLGLGILAVLLRERIAKLGERLSDWQA